MDFQVSIPPKEHFKFNEVSSLLNVKPYVLRFWETEFPQIGVRELEDGSKLYSHQSLRVIEKIKELLFDEKLSIPEAKSWLDQNPDLEREEAKTSNPHEMIHEALGENVVINSNERSLSSQMSGQDKLALNLDNILKTIDSIIEKNKWS